MNQAQRLFWWAIDSPLRFLAIWAIVGLLVWAVLAVFGWMVVELWA